MGYAAQLIDAVKDACGYASYTSLAEALGVDKTTLSQWRHGRGSPMPEERVMQLCEMARIADPGPWLVGIHVDGVKATGVRRALESVLDRVRPAVAAVGLLALGAFTLQSGSAHAMQNLDESAGYGSNSSRNIDYVKKASRGAHLSTHPSTHPSAHPQRRA